MGDLSFNTTCVRQRYSMMVMREGSLVEDLVQIPAPPTDALITEQLFHISYIRVLANTPNS